MGMEHVTLSWEPVYARLDGGDHAVTALVHQAHGVLVVLIHANVKMEQDAIMKQVSEISVLKTLSKGDPHFIHGLPS